MPDRVECVDCGEVLYDGEDEAPAPAPLLALGDERTPCPQCGSRKRKAHVLATTRLGVSATMLPPKVQRGVNEARLSTMLALVGVAVSIGLTVGFASCALIGIFAGVGSHSPDCSRSSPAFPRSGIRPCA